MLVVLNIKNFALIQELSVEFGAGFNILSGETGAGKSILICRSYIWYWKWWNLYFTKWFKHRSRWAISCIKGNNYFRKKYN